MNKQELDILLTLSFENYSNQRCLSNKTGYSLGLVNRCIKKLSESGYLDGEVRLTEKAEKLFAKSRPQNAIILAAGFGMRMVPINMETPKALLEVKGERLIERLIKQLNEVGIEEIYVVVGFMKESFEYLIDEFGVKLLVNPEYTAKNNLYSLYLASEYISNTYILPCDLWCAENPFRERELYSWYMVSEVLTEESEVRINRKMELVKIPADVRGNDMVGISCILEKDAAEIKKSLKELSRDKKYDGSFWEESLYQNERMVLHPRLMEPAGIVEIDTYEQLRELDSASNQLKSDAISVAAAALKAKENEITGISSLKKGMTNHSFSFECRGKRYIMRIPGEGTEHLINRKEEAETYREICKQNICDEIICFDEENGYKVTEYIEGARVCDPCLESDIRKW